MAKKKTISTIDTTCNNTGLKCKTSGDCCPYTETCSGGVCTSPNSDPALHRTCTPDPTKPDDCPPCIKACNTPVPKGVQPYCYANDDEHPNDIQICAYEKDGFLIPAEGCCDKPCPSEDCTLKEAPAALPEQTRPVGAPTTKKDDPPDDEPFPKLIKLLLIIFGILLIVAGIFLSVN